MLAPQITNPIFFPINFLFKGQIAAATTAPAAGSTASLASSCNRDKPAQI